MAQNKNKTYTKRDKRRYKKGYRKYLLKKVTKQTDKMNTRDPSIELVNFQKNPIITVSKTCPYTSCNSIAGAVNGAGNSFIFDPSGTYGNVSSGGGSLVMPDFTSLTGVFDLYRVNYIKIHMFADWGNGGTSTDPQELYMRYNYEPSVLTPTLAGMTQLTKVIKKTFTPDRPRYTYIIKPKVRAAIYNSGAAAGWGNEIRSMKWTDVQNPVQLLGFSFYCPGQITGQSIRFEIEYNVSFKYSK